MQNAIAHEIALVMNWLRWHTQAVEIRRVATVIREELDRLATRFKRATFTSPSTEAFDAIGEALRYLHRVAESIAEPPRPAAVAHPNRSGLGTTRGKHPSRGHAGLPTMARRDRRQSKTR